MDKLSRGRWAPGRLGGIRAALGEEVAVIPIPGASTGAVSAELWRELGPHLAKREVGQQAAPVQASVENRNTQLTAVEEDIMAKTADAGTSGKLLGRYSGREVGNQAGRAGTRPGGQGGGQSRRQVRGEARG